MSEWTDDEIARIAKGICCPNGCIGGRHFTCVSYQIEPVLRAALSAVRRVPEGYFPALESGVGKMLDAKDAEIARLTAERDAAISEIGKAARETHTAAWNEAIEAAIKAKPTRERDVDSYGRGFNDGVHEKNKAIRELKR